MICSEKGNVVWNENKEGDTFCVGYNQIFTDITATTFKSTGRAVSPVFAVQLNYSN